MFNIEDLANAKKIWNDESLVVIGLAVFDGKYYMGPKDLLVYNGCLIID